MDAATAAGADIVVVTETHLRESVSTSVPSDLGFSSFRGRGRANAAGALPGGGVAVASLRPDLTLTTMRDTTLGGIAVRVEQRGGRGTVFVVAVYLPPAGSPYEDDRAPLLAWAFRAYDDLSRLGLTVVVGDFNTRLGSLGGRVSLDTTRPPWKRRRARDAAAEHAEGDADGGRCASRFARHLWQLCRARGLSPVHGRSADLPGYTTSRVVTVSDGEGTSEVDFVVAPNEGGAVTALAPPPWGPAPHGLSHRPVLATVALPPPRVARARAAAGRRPQPRPCYRDVAKWNAVAVSLRQQLGGVAPAAATAAVWEAAAHAVIAEHSVPAVARRRPDVAHEGGGGTMPPWLVERIEATRATRAALARLAPGSLERAVADGAWKAECLENKRAVRRVRRQRQAAAAHQIERLCVADPHAQMTALNRLLPADPGRQGGDGGNAVPLEAFHATLSAAAAAGPPPPAVGNAAAFAFVPIAPERYDSTGLDARITSDEVALACFPPRAARPPPTCGTLGAVLGAPCATCDRERRRHREAVARGPDARLPVAGPCLHTSVGASSDNILHEWLRWACLACDAKGEALAAFRAEQSTFLATALNRILDDPREAPPSFFEYHTTPILKPGQPPGDAESYRAISCGGYLAKLLDAIVARRLAHWAQRNGMIDGAQIGFASARSAEEHVATLLETLRHRRHVGKRDTYLLFVDLKRAYDRVNPTALWAVLAHMGVPPKLIALLRELAARRRSRAKSGGALSEWYDVLTGVAQGGVSSPKLFNLFIESLSRELAALPGYRGVGVAGAVVRHLLYADDLVVACDSVEQLQLVADAVARWCALWGMEANLGATKTAVMRVAADGAPCGKKAAPGAAPAAVFWRVPPPPGAAAGAAAAYPVVPWTDAYRYLGFPLTSSLGTAGFEGQQLAQLKTAWGRYFACNPLAGDLSLTALLQLFFTVVSGTTTYLRGAVLLTERQLQPLDAYVRRCLRKLLRLPRGTPIALLYAHTGAPVGVATQAQHASRLRLHVEHSAGSVAHAVLGALDAAPAHAAVSLALQLRRLHRRAERVYRGGEPPTAAWDGAAGDAAALYGRGVGLGWMADEQNDILSATRPPRPFLARPRERPREAVVDAMSGARSSREHAVGLYANPAASVSGPCQRGSFARWADLPSHLACAALANALGALGMWQPPYLAARGTRAAPSADRGDVGDGVDAAEEGGDASDGDGDDALPVTHAARAMWSRCALCGDARCDPYHVLLLCTHWRLARARVALQAGLPRVLRALFDTATRELGRDAGSPLAGHTDASLEALAAGLRVDTPDGRALAFRLLCLLTWGARAVDDPVAAPVSALLGRVFDGLTGRTAHLRGAARAVVSWAAGATRRAAEARRTAIADLVPRPWTRFVRLDARPPVVAAFPAGGAITAASLPASVYPRVTYARNDVCHFCSFGGTLWECAMCNAAVCATGSEGACDALTDDVGADAEWLCPACAAEMAPHAVADGLVEPVRRLHGTGVATTIAVPSPVASPAAAGAVRRDPTAIRGPTPPRGR